MKPTSGAADKCALCPRPSLPAHGMCPSCYEQDLIRGARVRWQAVPERQQGAREALRSVADLAFRAAMESFEDRGAWLDSFRAVERAAAAARREAEDVVQLHNNAAEKALELWHARGREGRPALRLEDLPPEDPR